MISWGLVSAATMFATGPASFYALRFLLGVAEAGFFPGVILYLTYWFPARRRAHAVALFVLAIPLASAIGSPVSGLILQAVGDGALRGWQWLFLIEALPSIALGLVVLAKLPNGPGDARWLSAEERALVDASLAEERAARPARGQRQRMGEVLLDWRVWALALADFLRGMINNVLNFWMPTLVQDLGIPRRAYLEVGLVTAIPWGVAAVAMVVVARHSDHTGERRWHATCSLLLSAAGLLLLAFAGRAPIVSVVALAMVATGAMAWLAVFWTLPTAFLSGVAAAGGIAWINALSQLGGFVGPDMLGRIRAGNGGEDALAFLILAGCALVAAAFTVILTKPAPEPRGTATAARNGNARSSR
jgi:MFS family permease